MLVNYAERDSVTQKDLDLAKRLGEKIMELEQNDGLGDKDERLPKRKRQS